MKPTLFLVTMKDWIFSLPETVEHFPVWLHAQHDVVRGGVVDEGALRVHEKHVGDPDLLHQPAIKCHAEVVGAGKRQPLVLPVVPQVEGHCKVLGAEGQRGNPRHTQTHWVWAGDSVPLWSHHLAGE